MRGGLFEVCHLCVQGQQPLFSKDRSRFVLSLPVKQGGQGDFNHITMFTKKVTTTRTSIHRKMLLSPVS